MAKRYSGQVILESGSATQLPDFICNVINFTGLPDNIQEIFIGNDGNDSVCALTGFPLTPSGTGVRIRIDGNLNALYGRATVNDDVLCWIISED